MKKVVGIILGLLWVSWNVWYKLTWTHWFNLIYQNIFEAYVVGRFPWNGKVKKMLEYETLKSIFVSIKI